MTGKERCAYLKGLRKKAAADNGIDYEPPVCTYQGDCLGTCPRCEAELASLTKRIAAVGLAVAMTGSLAGCTPEENKPVPTSVVETTNSSQISGNFEIAPTTAAEVTTEADTTEAETTVIEETYVREIMPTDDGTLSGEVCEVTVEETVETTVEEVEPSATEPLAGDMDYIEPTLVPEDIVFPDISAGVLPPKQPR